MLVPSILIEASAAQSLNVCYVYMNAITYVYNLPIKQTNIECKFWIYQIYIFNSNEEKFCNFHIFLVLIRIKANIWTFVEVCYVCLRNNWSPLFDIGLNKLNLIRWEIVHCVVLVVVMGYFIEAIKHIGNSNYLATRVRVCLG